MSFTKYTVTGSVARIGASESLFLTQPQAIARAHALTEEGKGVFTAKQPLEFKAGEVIGLTVKEDALPRYLGDILRPSTKEEIAAAEKAHKEALRAAADAEDRGSERAAKEKAARQAKVDAGKSRTERDRKAAQETERAAALAKAAEDKRAEEEAARIAAGGQ